MILNPLPLTKWFTTCSLASALFFCGSFASLAQESGAKTAKPRAQPTDTKEWKGDFDGMVKRRHIRMVVPYSRTLYFNDHGRELWGQVYYCSQAGYVVKVGSGSTLTDRISGRSLSCHRPGGPSGGNL
jgi:hypothetical protein